ncbi:Spy/CpxP family protein refolding chaperone [Halodesulfovibrio spirochaetisodalis]|uniref:Spy/CpxP family protein refolding chaperone n=1 Tax=Halodesulfovibrio spirochaetisodalis TaxID=1560234 RepID=UPI00082FB42B|nr:periplasmic heavy metal sensor [Halodesulfovibrio spirochaetisodalis]
MRFKALKMFLAVACLMTVATTAALAAGPTWTDLSEAQQQKYMTLHDGFIKKTTPLRDAMWAKRVELEAVMNNENVDVEKVKNIVTEINKLRAEMRTEREAFAATVKKEVGIEPLANPHRGNKMMGDCPMGMKRGHGGHGMHRGMGGKGMGHGMMKGCDNMMQNSAPAAPAQPETPAK